MTSRKERREWSRLHGVCRNCGEKGRHYAPPGFRSPGMYICKPKTEEAGVTDETDTTSEVARVLGEHHGWTVTGERVRTSDVTVYGCRGCPAEIWRDEEHKGWTAPAMRARFAAHQAAVLAEAGLLRDYAVNVHESCNRELGTALALAEEAQIATQEPAGEPAAGSAGRGASGGLGERLRALAPAARFPSDYARIWACADEADRLEVVSNGARIKVQLDRVVALADEWDKAAERRSDLDGDLFDPTAADAYRSRAADLWDVLAQEVP